LYSISFLPVAVWNKAALAMIKTLISINDVEATNSRLEPKQPKALANSSNLLTARKANRTTALQGQSLELTYSFAYWPRKGNAKAPKAVPILLLYLAFHSANILLLFIRYLVVLIKRSSR
jgi:hypothetical protein